MPDTKPSPCRPTAPDGTEVHRWVAQIAALTQPDEVVWCDGSADQRQQLVDTMVAAGTLVPLDPVRRPGNYLARSDPSDVARVEGRTFICSRSKADAGPTNNWCEPARMRSELTKAFRGTMRGRTMFVIPFSMGPVGGPLSRIGVQITDSPYVVLSMGVMTRTGTAVRDLLQTGAPYVPAVHSVGHPLRDDEGHLHPDVPWPCHPTKIIAHFPETREIWSFGSAYGGNALLGKKCFALRIASAIGRDEGWLAEHMLLIRLTSPDGRRLHLAAAFPSACGKTNLAMLRPTLPGWSLETLGDDIVWLHPGQDGSLRALNPEAGFFGVAPGTSAHTNPTALTMLAKDTLFTNVALTEEGDVWWEGMTPQPPARLVDWTGRSWTPADGAAGHPAAHPNARFTTALTRCPTLAEDWDHPDGVRLDAIVLGGRRADTVPLVAQAHDWAHGVFLGATMASEQTAAAEGTVGQVRRDPFAMLPFCGYAMPDHWQHWLRIGAALDPDHQPLMFQVNWFRRDADGQFLWPGFGENARVLAWIADQVTRTRDGAATTGAVTTAAGLVPAPGTLNITGLDLEPQSVAAALAVDPEEWGREAEQIGELFARFGAHVPQALHDQLRLLRERITATTPEA